MKNKERICFISVAILMVIWLASLTVVSINNKKCHIHMDKHTTLAIASVIHNFKDVDIGDGSIYHVCKDCHLTLRDTSKWKYFNIYFDNGWVTATNYHLLHCINFPASIGFSDPNEIEKFDHSLNEAHSFTKVFDKDNSNIIHFICSECGLCVECDYNTKAFSFNKDYSEVMECKHE